MALTKNLLRKGVMNSKNRDEYFSIGDNGKKFEFYDHEGQKKIFEVHNYGDGNALFVRKNRRANTVKSYS